MLGATLLPSATVTETIRLLSRFLVPIASVVLILAVLHDAFEVMLLPRRVKSKMRIVRYFFDVTWSVWRAVGRRMNESRRQHFLGLYGPLSLVIMLVIWAGGLMLAFAGLYWSFDTNAATASQFLKEAYFSGVTFFTVGYGDVTPRGPWSKLLSVVEAGTGLGFIALVIGYLPVLYQLFSRREAHVIMLDAVAGSPPSAVALLVRHAEGRSMNSLDTMFASWQQWSAELLESQLSYPMLAYYRSQHDNQSWLAALTAVMDATVLVMVGFDGVPTFQAQLTFATARLALIEMGRVLDVRPSAVEENRLSPESFVVVTEALAHSGLSFVDPHEAEGRLTAFRTTYESFLYGLAKHLLLELPVWNPDPDQLANWVKSPRGKTAKRLVENVEAEPESK